MNNENRFINKFVHFGCWNNLNKKGNLPKVMNLLNNYLEEQSDFNCNLIMTENASGGKKRKN